MILFFALVYYLLVAGQRWYKFSLNFLTKYLRKNFFDTLEEFRYPNLLGAAELIDTNSIGFLNKSILILDGNQNSIFTRMHESWIKRIILNSKFGQIVTLRNFTYQKLN